MIGQNDDIKEVIIEGVVDSAGKADINLIKDLKQLTTRALPSTLGEAGSHLQRCKSLLSRLNSLIFMVKKEVREAQTEGLKHYLVHYGQLKKFSLEYTNDFIRSEYYRKYPDQAARQEKLKDLDLLLDYLSEQRRLIYSICDDVKEMLKDIRR